MQEFRERWKYFLMMEVIFLAFFLVDLFIRLGNPDLWHPAKGGERPMEFAYFQRHPEEHHFPALRPMVRGRLHQLLLLWLRDRRHAGQTAWYRAVHRLQFHPADAVCLPGSGSFFCGLEYPAWDSELQKPKDSDESGNRLFRLSLYCRHLGFLCDGFAWQPGHRPFVGSGFSASGSSWRCD